MDVPGDKLPSVASGALAAYLRETTAPQVPEQLRTAFLAAIDAGRLRSMLNKQMTLKPLHRPGALLLGDAFNMRCASSWGPLSSGCAKCGVLPARKPEHAAWPCASHALAPVLEVPLLCLATLYVWSIDI